ncbi:UbiA family prenyltransferase [Chitinophaga nivalis]|uniref:UbiA family prenyltransferase n=1 Tax=Chitinophaga nivalis TaxID=2991709 RepID=A0ABT3II87_9BACT|nr:UbiA family prenyltransferase [Chitinophaga nivalis]MCW3466673.1 UbiA family prenyltransferase [Chitinophaga nivalis]MCW3483636.1 UbiA family prenyltransferase [Chitinophaga nivalis]
MRAAHIDIEPVSKAICRELLLIWRFIKNDIWDTVIPCFVTFFTAWIYCKKPINELPLLLLFSIGYTLFYILTFCVANQINSVDEDRINKPDRPLVTGLISASMAGKRLIIYNILFDIIAVLLHLFWLALAWQFITLLLCRWGCSRHWITKNLVCISLGTITLLAAEWEIVDRLQPNVWSFIIVLSVWAGFGLPLQDMRDQEGDKVMERKTLPLEIGDRMARIMLSIYFLIVSPLIYCCAILTQIDLTRLFFNKPVIIILIIETLWHWWVAVRLHLYKTPRDDDKTYHLFVYLFIVTIPLICII